MGTVVTFLLSYTVHIPLALDPLLRLLVFFAQWVTQIFVKNLNGPSI